jgi:molybdopterin converting factor subunit 1
VPAGKVSVLYFAALRDLAGISEEAVELSSERLRVEQLLAELERRRPALHGRLRAGVRVAVNEEFVDLATPLAVGDVVALIPPVSGG